MRRYITLLLFIGLVWGQSTTIAVFDFENNGLEPYEVRQLSTRLESELVKVGKYNVVERSKIDEILKEQQLQMSGCVEECLIDVGKMLGANQIILGSVGKLGSIYTISAKLVDATSGEMVRTSDFDTDKSIGKLLTVGMMEIAFDLTGKDGFVKKDITPKEESTIISYNQNTKMKDDKIKTKVLNANPTAMNLYTLGYNEDNKLTQVNTAIKQNLIKSGRVENRNNKQVENTYISKRTKKTIALVITGAILITIYADMNNTSYYGWN